MNTRPGKYSGNLKPLALVLSILLLTLIYSFPSVAGKPTCPGHPSCKDTTDGPIQLGPWNDIWPDGVSNDGDDTVLGGDGDDKIYGGFGNDDLRGEAGKDTLEGEDGDDRLFGGDGVDTLRGGGGNDYMNLGGSEDGDRADGGAGYDSLDLRFFDNVTVHYEETPDDPNSWGSYDGSFYEKNVGTIWVHGEFKNIETINGSTMDGFYYGNNLANKIYGHEGNDMIYGFGGDDVLIGGGTTLSHNIKPEHIGDYINGGDGNDTISGRGGDDYIIGGPGDDDIYSREGGGHDVVEDFEAGEDRIRIYNSFTCFPDLEISLIDEDGLGGENDTQIAWGKRKDFATITLLNFTEVLVESDFIFNGDTHITYRDFECP